MKNIFAFTISSIILISCTGNHYHDGEYQTHFYIYDVDLKINGSNVEINNSIAGKSKMKCTQFKDRIEYDEGNGRTTVLTVLKDGSLKANELVVFKKIN